MIGIIQSSNDPHSQFKKYLDLMVGIKKKISHIEKIYNKHITTGSTEYDIELICLHLRKILEAICLGSVVMNKTEFERLQRDYISYKSNAQFFDQLKKINPDFYPKPIIQGEKDLNGNLQIFDRKEGFLKKEELISLTSELNKLAHVENPYAVPVDYNAYWIKIPEWLNRIHMLLHCHLIKLHGSKNFYRVYVYNQDDENVYAFEHIHPDNLTKRH
jgi:hypothetical protein